MSGLVKTEPTAGTAPAVAQEDAGGLGEAREARGVGRGLVGEGLVDDEALGREPLGGLERRVERQRAVVAQGLVPQGWSARDADRQSGVDDGVEVHRRAVGVGEGGGGVGRRRGLAAVDRADPLRRGVVVDEEAATADAGAVGLRDAEGSGRRDGGIGGVATAGQHVDADLRRITVDRGDRSAGAGHDRHLGQLGRLAVPAAVAAGGCRRGGLGLRAGRGRQHRERESDDEGAEDPSGTCRGACAVTTHDPTVPARRHRRSRRAAHRSESGAGVTTRPLDAVGQPQRVGRRRGHSTGGRAPTRPAWAGTQASSEQRREPATPRGDGLSTA